MSTYAATTSVSVEKSEAELKSVLRRFGADSVLSGNEGTTHVVRFRYEGIYCQFQMELPDPNEHKFTHHSRGKRTAASAEEQWEQACRSTWRTFVLAVKAKLAMVETQISSFDVEFSPYVLLPDGTTAGDHMQVAIQRAYSDGQMPDFSMLALPAGGES